MAKLRKINSKVGEIFEVFKEVFEVFSKHYLGGIGLELIPEKLESTLSEKIEIRFFECSP